MIVKKLTLASPNFPEVLRNIPTPPSLLYVAGDSLQDLLQRPRVTIVGTRKVTPYGRAVTTQLATELARAGVVIVSGLAYGVDSIAHRAALEAGGQVIAVLPTSIERIYPAAHRGLAQDILQQGGVLITEYAADAAVYKTNFVARNRLAAGLGDITLVTEAAIKSGTIHTTRFALEQGKDVMAVPGNITSITSGGTNNLIKSGALPVTEVADILHALGIAPVKKAAPAGDTPAEQTILNLLSEGHDDGSTLQALSNLEIQAFNQNLTMLEITGKIRSLGNNKWALS
jgi:DNA processing protein